MGVDAPPADNFQIMPSIDAVTNPRISYLRAHGRNTKGYLTGRSVAERFAWHYTDDELEEIAGRARTLAESAGEVHVAFNNNRGDDAPTAAQRFRALLGQEIPEPDDPQLTLLARSGQLEPDPLGAVVLLDAPLAGEPLDEEEPPAAVRVVRLGGLDLDVPGSKAGPSSATSVRTADLPIATRSVSESQSVCRTLFVTSSVTSSRSVSMSGGSRSARSCAIARRASARRPCCRAGACSARRPPADARSRACCTRGQATVSGHVNSGALPRVQWPVCVAMRASPELAFLGA